MEGSEANDELRAWTLGLGDAAFVHQHVVDAWMAQTADESTKPIGILFALVGLHLHLERGFSGREVQRAHMRLAKRREVWPAFPLPADRGQIGPAEVLSAAPGPDRVRAIDAWCASVWSAFEPSHDTVAAWLHERDII